MSRIDLIGLFATETLPATHTKQAFLGAAVKAIPGVLNTAKNMVGWAAPKVLHRAADNAVDVGKWAVKNPATAAGTAYMGAETAHGVGQATLGDNSPTNLISAPLNAVSKTLGSITPLVRGTLATPFSYASQGLGYGLGKVLPNNSPVVRNPNHVDFGKKLSVGSPTLAGVNSFSGNMVDARNAGFNDVGENMGAALTNNHGLGEAADPYIGNNTSQQMAGVNQQLAPGDRWAGTVGDIAHQVGNASANTAPFMMGGGAATLAGKLSAGAGVGLQAGSPALNTIMDGPVGLRAQDQQPTAPPTTSPTTSPTTPPTVPVANPADKASIATTGDVTPKTNQGAFAKLQELVSDPQKAWTLFQQLDPESKIALMSGLALGGAGLINHIAGGEGSTSAMLGALGLGVGGAGIYNAMNGGDPWNQVKSWASNLGKPADPATPPPAAPTPPVAPAAIPTNAATAPNGAESTVAASQTPAPTAAPNKTEYLSQDPDHNQLFNATKNLMATSPEQRPAVMAGLLGKLKPEQLSSLTTYSAGRAVPFLMGSYLGADKAQVQQFLTQNWPQLQAMAKQQMARGQVPT